MMASLLAVWGFSSCSEWSIDTTLLVAVMCLRSESAKVREPKGKRKRRPAHEAARLVRQAFNNRKLDVQERSDLLNRALDLIPTSRSATKLLTTTMMEWSMAAV